MAAPTKNKKKAATQDKKLPPAVGMWKRPVAGFQNLRRNRPENQETAVEAQLIDTNIFIDTFRGNTTFHYHIRENRCYINDVIYIELIQGGRLSQRDLAHIKSYIRPLTRIHISQQISITAVALVEQYGSGFGLMFADALIAATCLV